MADKLNMQQRLSTMVQRNRKFFDGMKFRGLIMTELYRGGKLIEVVTANNDVVIEGKNLLLNSFFRNTAPPGAWYHGLIDNTGYAGLSSADTMASHAGWAEFTGYSQANRPTWSPAAASGAAIINASPMAFNITSAGTLQGGFITTSNIIGGATGSLWATALYATPLVVGIGDVVQNTYGISC